MSKVPAGRHPDLEGQQLFTFVGPDYTPQDCERLWTTNSQELIDLEADVHETGCTVAEVEAALEEWIIKLAEHANKQWATKGYNIPLDMTNFDKAVSYGQPVVSLCDDTCCQSCSPAENEHTILG